MTRDMNLRIATYNVEWFTNLFDRDGRPAFDDRPMRHGQVSAREQAEAIARVMATVDADLILVVEAPDDAVGRYTRVSLEMFAAAFGLRTRACLHGMASTTAQEIALLYDPDRVRVGLAPEPGRHPVPKVHGLSSGDHVFDKPPLEAVVQAGAQDFHLIGVHIKSKITHGETASNMHRLALRNRRKQLAQSLWLRERVEQLLEERKSVILLGDLNDGPGLDEYEEILGQSALEVIAGQLGPGHYLLHDPHARIGTAPTLAQPASARFWSVAEQQYFGAIVDYIMVSGDLCANRPAWRIWHPFDDPACYRDPELRDALLAASDHYPVSLDLVVHAPPESGA
ncbi:endonuclease/exonuclease/phosphatase family protein [Thioclava sp. 'Guangxiensis']|uniref:endonuclease/exonuclease/phosphatase family protein n=1 Tax=Thioclava sp. 'Guangxiensis' TaxID=3149044 RepID=UPI003877998F